MNNKKPNRIKPRLACTIDQEVHEWIIKIAKEKEHGSVSHTVNALLWKAYKEEKAESEKEDGDDTGHQRGPASQRGAGESPLSTKTLFNSTRFQQARKDTSCEKR